MSKKENTHSGVRHVRIGPDADGQRIDNFLASELPGVPKGRIYRMLRKGEVRINKGRVRPTSRVREGDDVRIPPVSLEARQQPAVPRGLQAQLEAALLFEDRDLLVIDKPAGVAVHGGSGVSLGCVEALRAMRDDWQELGLAHRLDRETSGVLVLAKRRSALRRLHAAFREDRVSKVYEALVDRHWDHGNMAIDAPLQVHTRRGGERHVTVDAGGKPSVTEVQRVDSCRDASLMVARPLTGRTHQIRVHLQHMGHPIVGDARYGDPERNDWHAKRGLKRLFLHAQSIAFDFGDGNERLFTAPLPEPLSTYAQRLFSSGGKR
ncbi:MAG: RluA family pseudouridine synthase [Pseudomonadota bacterium]